MSRPTTASLASLPPHQRWVAASLAVVVWLLGLFAAAPHWHAELHHACDHAHDAPAALPHDHVCAITWFSIGVEPLGNPAAAPVPVQPVTTEAQARETTLVGWTGEHRLPPACGPPVC